MTEIKYSDFAAIFEFPPTPEQKAVIINEDPAMLITAGAGAGKTATMSQRIAWQVMKGNVAADQVLGLTFTNKAAAELADRTNKQLRLCQAKLKRESHESEFVQAQAELRRPTVRTYNSFASEIASSYAVLIGENPNARLITEAERREIIINLFSQVEVEESRDFGNLDAPDGENNSQGINTEPKEVILESEEGESFSAIPKIILTSEEFKIFSESSQNTLVKNVAGIAAKVIDNDLNLDEYQQYLAQELQSLTQVSEGVRATSKYYENLDFSDSLVTKEDVQKSINSFKDSLKTIRLNLALVKVVSAYLSYKKTHGVIEFADQVSWACRILENVPEVAERIRSQYKMVLLDEYQDTSVTQARMLRIAFRGIPYICAVGDPMQAIYGWRGASANALSDFIADFYVKDDAQLTLSTAFRNSKNILQIANTLTAPLRSATEKLKLPILQAAPHSRSGKVIEISRNLKEDADQALSGFLKDVLGNGNRGEKTPSVAILVRTNRRALELSELLSEAKVRHEIIGGGLLIQTPEIKAIRALLTVCVDEESPADAVYVFNFFGISAHDLRAFAELRRLDYAPDTLAREVLNVDGWNFPQTNLTQLLQYFADDKQRFKKALRAVTEENTDFNNSNSAENYVKLSAEAQWRIEYLLAGIARLRNMQQSSLSEIIAEAARILQLQITADSRAAGGATIRNAIESFKKMGEAFASRSSSSIASFLQWLKLAELHDRDGVAQAEDAPAIIDLEEEIIEKPGTVQILTMHAAKGLEWDYVVIPDLVSGKIDPDSAKSTKPWFLDAEAIPDQLRMDAAHIPQFSFAKGVENLPPDLKPGEQKVALGYDLSHYQKKFFAYAQSEQRRLMYVAATRPRTQLVLTSYSFNKVEDIYRILELSTADTDKTIGLALGIQEAQEVALSGGEINWEELKKEFGIISRSSYLDEIKNNDASLIEVDLENEPTPLDSEFFNWFQEKFAELFASIDLSEITTNDELQKTLLQHSALHNQKELSWPSGVLRGIDFFAGGKEAEKSTLENSATDLQKAQEILFASAEYVLNRQLINSEAGNFEPDYLTASNMVSLFTDSEEFFRNQIRPVPRKPLPAAYTGTEVHAQIASHFAGVLKLDLDELESWNIQDAESADESTEDLAQARITELVNRFEASEFAELEPIAIEKPLEFLLADKPIRCVIDAVFDTSKVSGRAKVTIVDWKTGRKPKSELLESRKLQLALYTHAWAKTTGTALEDIEAIFYYLGEDNPAQRELRTEIIPEEQLAELIKEKMSYLVAGFKDQQTEE